MLKKNITTKLAIASIVASFSAANAVQLDGAAIDKGNASVALLAVNKADNVNHDERENELIFGKAIANFLELEAAAVFGQGGNPESEKKDSYEEKGLDLVAYFEATEFLDMIPFYVGVKLGYSINKGSDNDELSYAIMGEKSFLNDKFTYLINIGFTDSEEEGEDLSREINQGIYYNHSDLISGGVEIFRDFAANNDDETNTYIGLVAMGAIKGIGYEVGFMKGTGGVADKDNSRIFKLELAYDLPF